MATIIVWDEANKHLPTEQTPERREERKALFKKMLAKDKKTLTLTEVIKGMKNHLRHDMAGSYVPGIGAEEMKKCITHAFQASSTLAPSSGQPAVKKTQSSAKVSTGVAHAKSKGKKKGDGESIDKKEFHAFLVALKYYLELVEFFEQLDGAFDDDQKLSCREVLKGKDKLESWGISEDMVKTEGFPDVDPWKATMKFDEFAAFIMGHRMAELDLKLDDSDDEEVQKLAASAEMKAGVELTFSSLGAESDLNQMKVKEKFAAWDDDGNGLISYEELAAVMKKLNPSFTDKKCQLLFDAADTNKDGSIDMNEFVEFIFKI